MANDGLWLLGVLLGIAAGVINALGIVLQKKAHVRDSFKSDGKSTVLDFLSPTPLLLDFFFGSQMVNLALPVEQQKNFCLNPRWLFGYGTYVVGNTAAAFALTFAPQSVIRYVPFLSGIYIFYIICYFPLAFSCQDFLHVCFLRQSTAR